MKKFIATSMSCHGQKNFEFDTLEEAVRAADKMQKTRKSSIEVLEFVRINEEGHKEYVAVYNTQFGGFRTQPTRWTFY